MKKIFLIFLLTAANLFADDLPRKGSLGVMVKPSEYPQNAMIVSIEPNGTAHKIQMQINDIIKSINGRNLNEYKQIFEELSKLKAGDKIEVSIERRGEAMTLSGIMEAAPYVSSEEYDIIYSSVPFRDGKLRSYINKPKGNDKYPTVYYIQGYPCQDVEYRHPKNPIRQMIEGLVSKGFAVYRIEKPGLGDSHNTPDCSEIDFATEVEAFEAGYNQLMKEDFVDRENVFVYGHSLGGLVAPIMDVSPEPKGIIVYGTGLYSWQDYMIKLYRMQYPLYGFTHAQVEDMIVKSRDIIHDFYEERNSPDEIIKSGADPQLVQQILNYSGGDQIMTRHYSFWQDLNSFNFVKGWQETPSKVFALYGEYDIAALDEDAAVKIAEIVNTYNPGNAEFKIVPETEHGYLKVESTIAGMKLISTSGYTKNGDLFNPDVVNIVSEWIKENM